MMMIADVIVVLIAVALLCGTIYLFGDGSDV